MVSGQSGTNVLFSSALIRDLELQLHGFGTIELTITMSAKQFWTTEENLIDPASPGELVRVPGLSKKLWVVEAKPGHFVVAEVSLEPTAYQYGDWVSLSGSPGNRKISGVRRAAQSQTIWFEFEKSLPEAERNIVIQSLSPLCDRMNRKDDRLALVVSPNSVDPTLKIIAHYRAKRYGFLSDSQDLFWPLSRTGKVLNGLLIGLTPIFVAGLSVCVVYGDQTVYFELAANSGLGAFLMGSVIARFVFTDPSRAKVRKYLSLGLLILAMALIAASPEWTAALGIELPASGDTFRNREW